MIILGQFFLFLPKNVCCGLPHLKCLAEVLQMSTHNICFHRELEKIIPELSKKYSSLTIPLPALVAHLDAPSDWRPGDRVQPPPRPATFFRGD